ncbi:Testis-specific serine/threonine-protein kinase 1, partial [Geodia barretti]
MGCILFAMVCGSLPYGDDTRVVQMIQKPLHFPKPLTTECKHLLRSGMLNTDSERRYDITELRLSLWMRAPAVPLTPYSTTKISAE